MGTTEVVDDEEQHVVTAGSIITVTVRIERVSLNHFFENTRELDGSDLEDEAGDEGVEQEQDNIDEEEDEKALEEEKKKAQAWKKPQQKKKGKLKAKQQILLPILKLKRLLMSSLVGRSLP